MTYTVLTVFVALVIVLILFNSYREAITREVGEFVSSNFSLYFGAFLLAVSVAFIVETDDVLVTAASTGLTIAAIAIIAVYLARRVCGTKEKNTETSEQTQEPSAPTANLTKEKSIK